MPDVDLCLCGRPWLLTCPACGRQVMVTHGKLVAHEAAYCTGSHLEYKTCKGTGRRPAPPKNPINLANLLGQFPAFQEAAARGKD